jgi:hypothetical protein
MSVVSSDDIKRFHEDGVVCLRNCISPHWLGFLRTAMSDLKASPGPMAEHVKGRAADLFTDLEMAQRMPAFAEFSRLGPCAGLAGTLMKAEQCCFLYDQAFSTTSNTVAAGQLARHEGEEGAEEEEGSGNDGDGRLPASPSTPWHQDQPYWQVAGSQVASVWLPLDTPPAGSELLFIAGSHRWQEHSPFHFASGAAYKGTEMPALPDIDAGVIDGTIHLLKWDDVRPGDALVFSAMTVHGQARAVPGGRTRQPLSSFSRLATRFTGDDARYVLRRGEARDVVPSRHFPCSLSPGDEMECSRFPKVWQRGDKSDPRAGQPGSSRL